MTIVHPVPLPKGKLILGGPMPKLEICVEITTVGATDENGNPAGVVKVITMPVGGTPIPVSPMAGATNVPQDAVDPDLWKITNWSINQPLPQMRFIAWILASASSTTAFQIESRLIKPDFAAGETDCDALAASSTKNSSEEEKS